MKILIIPKQIVTVNADDKILRDSALEITDGIITNFVEKPAVNKNEYDEVYNFESLTLIPGFVQTHIHLCQTLFRGLADDLELLDWLQQRIFPYENSHNAESLRASAKLGIHELLSGGTTTLLDMGTINNEEVIFDELIYSGMRGFAGKCMVDQNELFPSFKETTKDSLNSSYQLSKEFHNAKNGRLKYGFAPRFVLSCSENLLKNTVEMMSDFDGSLYHTHASENKSEIETVRRMTGKENIEYFESIGVLSDRTVLAHGIHVNEKETTILKEKNVRISHCPSSNLKLGSGIADIPHYLDEGISISLGADGPPCNNNLSMFTEMRLAALIQKPIHGPTSMDAKTVFRLATIDGANALHLGKEIGSVEIGKKADLALLDLNGSDKSLTNSDLNIYSDIVYASSKSDVKNVMIEGKWVVKDGLSTIYDEGEIVNIGKKELKRLLDRVEI